MDGQLTGGGNDEGPLGLIEEHFGDEGDEKSGGLAGAGIGNADDVAASQGQRNDLVLDRGRGGVAVGKNIGC